MLLVENYIKPIYHLLFPHVCNGCGTELLSNEKTICTTCLSFMPKTNFHLIINNPMEQKMAVRTHIENATAYCYFNKGGAIQHLLHGLKYERKQEIGHLLGRRFGKQIEDERWLQDIDLLMPIPLSKQKLKARGFNQSESITLGMADALNKPMDTAAVIRTKNTASQTNKTRAERISNMTDAFLVAYPEFIRNKHILLIDDVITTGATLEACADIILKVPGTRVSMATLAYAVE